MLNDRILKKTIKYPYRITVIKLQQQLAMNFELYT